MWSSRPSRASCRRAPTGAALLPENPQSHRVEALRRREVVLAPLAVGGVDLEAVRLHPEAQAVVQRRLLALDAVDLQDAVQLRREQQRLEAESPGAAQLVQRVV